MRKYYQNGNLLLYVKLTGKNTNYQVDIALNCYEIELI